MPGGVASGPNARPSEAKVDDDRVEEFNAAAWRAAATGAAYGDGEAWRVWLPRVPDDAKDMARGWMWLECGSMGDAEGVTRCGEGLAGVWV